VCEEKINTLLTLNSPSAPDLGQPLSCVKISPRKRGQPKSLEKALLLEVSGGPLADSFCADGKVQPVPLYPKL